MKNKFTDTSDILNEGDIVLMNKIQAIKNHVFSIIDKERIVEILRNIVDDSEIVDFKNDRFRKFIDAERPILNLRLDETKMEDEYGKLNPKSEEDEASYYQNVVYHEVIKHFSDFVNASIKGTDKVKNYLEDEKDIFTDVIQDITEEEIMDVVHVFSTIFGMRLNQDDKTNILLELIY